MTKKFISTAIILLLLPVFALASEPVLISKVAFQNNFATTSSTSGQATEEAKKDTKKEELKKQLTDTINTYSAIVNSLQRLSQRVSERKDILLGQKEIDEYSKIKIDTKIAALNNDLDNLNDRINGVLTRAGDALVESTKPAKPLREFKKEAIKIKTEIISAHKLIVEIIDLVKKESLKPEIKNDAENQNEEVIQKDQNN